MKALAKVSLPGNIPLPVQSFLKKALLIFIIWKLLYHLLLLPVRIPDQQLTNLTAATTGFLYNAVFNSHINFREEFNYGYKMRVIYIEKRRVIGIADGCNGLELYVLYLGFLLCIPTTTKRLVAYAVLGIAGIYITNSLRCFGLAWLFLHNYSIANFAHHYLFKMIIYALIFFTWVRYSNKYLSNG